MPFSLYRVDLCRPISIIVWDRDRSRKNYVGEVELWWNDLFDATNPVYSINDPNNKGKWFNVTSLRGEKNEPAGKILLKIGLDSRTASVNAADTWRQLISQFESIDPTKVVRKSELPILPGPGDDEEDEDEFDTDRSTISLEDEIFLQEELVGLTIGDEDEEEDEIDEEDDDIASELSEAPSETGEVEVGPSSAPAAPSLITPATSHRKGKRRPGRRRRKHRHFEFTANSNVVGVVFLEIVGVSDLPPERNVTRMGFDMDPFVVISFGKKTFRTPWKRHTLNPVFNEKLLFPVHHHERNFSVGLTVMDKDRFSLNDFVCDSSINIKEILKTAPKPDPETGLYKPQSLVMTSEQQPKMSRRRRMSRKLRRSSKPARFETPMQSEFVTSESSVDTSSRRSDAKSSSELLRPPDLGESSIADELDSVPIVDDDDFKTFLSPLTLKQKSKWEDKHNPCITLRAKFLPYPALRQHFWRGLIRLYDTDDTETISHIELRTMLDSLGSTLSSSTIDGFFERFGRTTEDELSIDEVIICLEEQVMRDSIVQSTWGGVQIPSDSESLLTDDESFTRKPSNISIPYSDYESSASLRSNQRADSRTDQSRIDLSKSDLSVKSDVFDLEGSPPDDATANGGKVSERVIQISSCPVCNQPRLKKKYEIDIVTHLAICASQNWSRVDALVMDQYISSNQASKRWYSKVASKVSYGNYKLGANSANILVQDRVTGYILEEKMSPYVRMGIRLLYKGIRSSQRMEGRRIRRLLRSLSVKQGRKYDSPSSAQAIRPFIKFHCIYMDEVLEPVENFKTFNEFFYRKLKPDARKCDAPGEPRVVVSPADCRSTMFESVSRATEIWIKGREFSIERLFGTAYPDLVDKFIDGPLAIFRLAPQDYHRFHIPVDGVLGEPRTIEGEYYTVNPMAIRSALDVYGENVRVLVPIESEEFGTVMVVCVGAMMVGSTVITAKAGSRVSRTDELGYFQFGGSTLVVLFQKGKVKFDEDLLENSKGAVETLVRVGMSIGHSPDVPEWDRGDPKSPEYSSPAQVAWAKRAITGGEVGDKLF